MSATASKPVSNPLTTLAQGFDTATMDVFLENLIAIAFRHGSLICSLNADDVISLQTPVGLLHEAAIPRAKTKIRMLCARLAVHCSSWSNRDVSPYGDDVEFIHPVLKQRFRTRFENTTSAQSIVIESQNIDGR